MSTSVSNASGPTADAAATVRPPDPGRGSAHGRRRWIVAGVVVAVLVAVAVTVGVVHPFPGRKAKPGVPDNGSATSLATVTQRDLSAQTAVNATLGYAGSYSVVNQSPGLITWLPAVGAVIHQGQVLYRVNGAPVVLLYGSTPAYRSLSAGRYASDVTGPDVAELNAALVALGYATRSQIPAGSDEFSSGTKAAVQKLQKPLGMTPDNGTLELGQAAFLPTAARITTVSATLGAPVAPGGMILSATSTTRQVTISLDASQQSEVKVGDKVTITLPDNQTTPGAVASVGTVATAPVMQIAAGVSDVRASGKAEGIEAQIAEAGRGSRRGTGPQLGIVLPEGHVTCPM